jgi:small-conductance mechanosensitive channel
MDYLIYAVHANLRFVEAYVSARLTDIVLALLITLGGWVFYLLTSKVFRRFLRRSLIHDAFARILINHVYKILVVVVTLITAASQLGINILAALAGLGIIGIAIGFAAQDSLSNVVAGVLIFLDKPFRVGDYVTLGEHYGRVELITLRSTRIRTQDNTYVVIPNQKIINDVLVDHSTNGETRLLVPVAITYESSIDDAREAVTKALSGIEGVLAAPAPDLVIDRLGESGVQAIARFWIANAAEERRYHFRATEAVKRALESVGVAIAYPRLELVNEKAQGRGFMDSTAGR